MNKNKSDTDSVHKHDFRLGINKKTGRLQWCPSCNCFRIMILVPAAVVPIVCLFLLLAHFDGVSSEKQEKNNFRFPSNENQLNEVEQVPNVDPKCRGIRAGVLREVLDVEERDLLKDTRTSFVPSLPLIIPPECQQPDQGNPIDLNERKTEQYEKELQRKRSNFVRKKRNELHIDFHNVPSVTSTVAPTKDDGNVTEILHKIHDEPLHVDSPEEDEDIEETLREIPD